MKRYFLRFRIVLLTLALGMASVPFFRTIRERWTRVDVDVPEIESSAPLFVTPYRMTDFPTLTGGRDLSLYEFIGDFPVCDDKKGLDARQCESLLEKGRRIVRQNWKAKKRSYFTITTISMHKEYSPTNSASPEILLTDRSDIFIEPGENGKWRTVLREEYGKYVWGRMINERHFESIEPFSENGNAELVFSGYEDTFVF